MFTEATVNQMKRKVTSCKIGHTHNISVFLTTLMNDLP